MKTVIRVLRGLAALVVLVALLFVVPGALWHYIGWPLPHAVPTWGQVRSGLTSQGIADETLIKVLAVVAWLAWASVAASVWTEAAAAARGRVARRLPGLAPVQAFAGQLITAVVLIVLPLGRTSSPHTRPALSLGLRPAGSQASSMPVPAVYAATPADPEAATSPPPSQPTYTVQRRDTLWGIAQQHLGDPLRWPEIYRINESRPQADGGTLANPNLIRPGWTLVLPAVTPAAQPIPPPPPESIPAPPALAAPGTTTPPTTAPRTPAAIPDEHPAAPVPAAQQPAPAERHDHGVKLPGGSLVGLGFAAGVAATLTTARLRRRAAYRPGPPQPAPGVIEPKTGEVVSSLQRAVRATTRADAGQTSTREPGRLAVGTDDSADVELNLLAGALDVHGPGADDMVRALLVDLIVNHRPDQAAVLLAGRDLETLLFGVDVTLPGVDVTLDLAGALARLEIEVIRRTRLLAEADAQDYCSYSDTHPEEPLPLLIAVHRSPALGSEPRLAAVESVAARLGVGMIGLQMNTRERWIDIGSEGEVRSARGIAIPTGARLYHLVAADAAQITKLVPAYGDGPQPDEPTHATAAAPATTWPNAEPSARVEVRLFGAEQLLVDGEEVRTGLRAKARELLAFLACRPDGTTWEAAAEALWPDIDAQRGNDRFRTVVANLRNAAGKLTDHDEGVVERVAERYRLNSRAITCDLWSFEAALRRDHSVRDDNERAQPLTEAAGLYRGDLCPGADYDWVEPVREDLRRRALDVIVALADTQVRAGQLEDAIVTLQRGIEIDEYAEAIYQRLIAVYGRRGQPDAARRVYTRLEERLDQIGADPTPATREELKSAVGGGLRRLSVVRGDPGGERSPNDD